MEKKQSGLVLDIDRLAVPYKGRGGGVTTSFLVRLISELEFFKSNYPNTNLSVVIIHHKNPHYSNFLKDIFLRIFLNVKEYSLSDVSVMHNKLVIFGTINIYFKYCSYSLITLFERQNICVHGVEIVIDEDLVEKYITEPDIFLLYDLNLRDIFKGISRIQVDDIASNLFNIVSNINNNNRKLSIIQKIKNIFKRIKR